MNKTLPELRVTPEEYSIIKKMNAARYLTSGEPHRLELDGLIISVHPAEWQVFQLNNLKITLRNGSLSEVTKTNIDSMIQQIQNSQLI